MKELCEDVKRELSQILAALDPRETRKLHVVCTPSFYLDHFVQVDDLSTFCSAIQAKYVGGGGNLPGFVQNVLSGGGAANTAIALSRLGVSSHFIGRTSELGRHVLKFFAENSGVDIAHVKTDGRLGQTLALEIGERRINVMLNDVGSNYDFAFDSLRDTDLELIENSQLVTVHDWGTNVVGGTDLAVKTFAYAKQYNVKTYFDSADPGPRVHDLTELYESVIASTNLDITSLNQNELEKHTGEATLERAIAFKRRVGSRVDYHTPWYAASIDDSVTVFPVYDVKLLRSTGAGDAWNSGNIFGELLALAPALRLCLANAVAGYYVSSRHGAHPTIDDLVAFVTTEKLRTLPTEVASVVK
ncbi:MAG: carbohydrate kinase family protein [Halobacteriota archaeon]